MLRAFGITDKGRVRPSNEDCFGIEAELALCVVADGMGGHNAGEVASAMAVESVVASVRTSTIEAPWPYGFNPAVSAMGNLLSGAIHAANKQIFDRATANPEYSGMGTTIVAAVEREGVLSVAHAGDSRLYLWRAGQLSQMTEDDSWIAAVLSRDPKADPATLKQHPMRNALTNVVGARASMAVNVKEFPLMAGDLCVLTTDGVHGVIEAPELASLVRAGGGLPAIAKRLIEKALTNGSRDNVTAVVGEYSPA